MIETLKKNSSATQDVSKRSLWISLCIILIVGIITRFLYLGHIYLWIDETPILGESLWSSHGGGFLGFLRGLWKLPHEVYSYQTDNGTWAALVYSLCKLFGVVSTWWARLPSALAGVLLLPVLFTLTRRITGSSVAGLAAAGAAVMSIVQIHYSQQIVPYGPSVLAGALVLWSTAVWLDKLSTKATKARYLPCGFLFFISVTGAALLHNCTLPLIVACFLVLAGSVLWFWNWGNLDRGEAIYNLTSLLQTGVVIILCSLVFVLPKLGESFRGYLSPYYAPADWNVTQKIPGIVLAIISFGIQRCYDLATYALNPIYSDKWYQPLGLNPLTIVPIMLTILGIVSLCVQLKVRRSFVVLALVTVFMLFVGALIRRYPFGGVRQCLPLTVFIYVFVGVGTWVIYRKWKLISIGLFSLWFLVWLFSLPPFYAKRLSPYDTQSLLHYARTTKTNLFVTVNDYGNPEDSVFKYYFRHHPEIKVFPLLNVFEDLRHERKPFVLALTTKSLRNLKSLNSSGEEFATKERAALLQLLSDRQVGLATLREIAVNPVVPSQIQDESQSIYTPLNGLFLYKIYWTNQ